MTSKAPSAKELGNAAFKAGDYPKAIGHYTQAILEDRNEPTYYLNRSAAYLKLGKYIDAENDCSKVITLSGKNVKGLFRRGQARIGLGKLDAAVRDLEAAIRLEPKNGSVLQELQKVKTLLEKGKQKAGPIEATGPPIRRRVPITIVDPEASSDTPPPRRRVPITVVEAPTPVQSEKAPVSASNPAPAAKPTSKPEEAETTASSSGDSPETSSRPTATFQDAKRTREAVRPTRVGGGIFRASGQSTLFPTRELDVTARTPPAPATGPAENINNALKPPVSLYEFNRQWENSSAHGDRYNLLKSIPPNGYPSLFKASLEPTLLMSIIKVMLAETVLSPDSVDLARQYLDAFGQVPRLSTLLMFLSKDEKQLVRAIVGRVGAENVGPVWKAI